MTLNILEKVTLNAFIEALRQLSSPLPTEFQQQINQVGNAFDKDPTSAINRLLDLAENDCIKQLYFQARIEIQKNYETQERNRFYSPEKQNQRGVKPDDATSNIALKVEALKAPDSPKAVQSLLPESTQPPLVDPVNYEEPPIIQPIF